MLDGRGGAVRQTVLSSVLKRNAFVSFVEKGDIYAFILCGNRC